MGFLGLGLLPDIPLLDDVIGESEVKLLVPGYRQMNGHACGPVSVYSVVKTFNRRANYRKIYAQCNPSEEEGTGVPEMLRTLRQNGVGVSVRWDLTFKSISDAIERGFPIIVGERTDDPDSGHWVVIYGIGRKPNRVFTCGQPNVVAFSGRESFTWQEWRSHWDEYGLGLICWGKR